MRFISLTVSVAIIEKALGDEFLAALSKGDTFFGEIFFDCNIR
jgi:hypothetical protein